jgi:hypothetical protein
MLGRFECTSDGKMRIGKKEVRMLCIFGV